MPLSPLDILNTTRQTLATGSPLDAFLQGREAGNTLEAQELQNQLLQQKLAQAPVQQQILEQQAQTGQFKLDQTQRDQVLTNLVGIAGQSQALPVERQAEFIRNAIDKLDIPVVGGGELVDELAQLSDEDVVKSAGQLLAFGKSKGLLGKSETSSQFGAQQTFKDERGNLFFGTTKRDPQTGEVKSVLAPVDGKSQPVGRIQQAGTYGLTAKEKIEQLGLEKTAQDRSAALEKTRQEYVSQGLAARNMIPKTKKLLDLNRAINTGKIAKAKKFMTDIFGITDPDVGQFNSLAGTLVLENIRALGANPTEGERAFLQQITPSIEQGGDVNEAILKDMLKIQERQVERAKWFSNNPNKTVEQYLLETDSEDFEPSKDVDSSVTTENVGFDPSLLQFMTPEERALFNASNP